MKPEDFKSLITEAHHRVAKCIREIPSMVLVDDAFGIDTSITLKLTQAPLNLVELSIRC